MDTMMQMDLIHDQYANNHNSIVPNHQNCFGLIDESARSATTSTASSNHGSFNYSSYNFNNSTSSSVSSSDNHHKGAPDMAANPNFSLLRHHSAPSSVLLGLLNDEEGEDPLSALLDMHSENLLADLDNLVPYPLPSISEHDAADSNPNPSSAPAMNTDHHHLIDPQDCYTSIRSNSSVDMMKRRRLRRRPPLPSPSPSPSPLPSPSPSLSGREPQQLIRHSSSPAHLISRMAMEEMQEMAMEMEMEKKKKIMMINSSAMVTNNLPPSPSSSSTTATISSGGGLYRQKSLKNPQQNLMRNQIMNHQSSSSRAGGIMVRNAADNGVSTTSAAAAAASSASSYSFNGMMNDLVTSSPALSTISSMVPSSSSVPLLRQSSSPAGLLSQLCLEEQQISKHQIPSRSEMEHQTQMKHAGGGNRNSESDTLLALDRDEVLAGLSNHHHHHHHHHNRAAENTASTSSPPPLAGGGGDQMLDFHTFDDYNNNNSSMDTMAEYGRNDIMSSPPPSLTSPSQARAKRGHATHPRSIAERVRRTKISERIKKLQDLVPNLDKQANTADMLDGVVEYVKLLQWKIQELSLNRSNNVVLCEECNTKKESK